MTDGKRRRRWPWICGGVVVLIGAAIALFQWDWLIPFVDARASAALGRAVRIAHLHVKLGKVPHIVADDVAIGNPQDWPGGGDFATAQHLTLDVDLMAYLHGRHIVLPLIALDQPAVDAQQMQDGKANWVLGSSAGSSDNSGNASSGNDVQIGKLEIDSGNVHVRSAKMGADFEVSVATKSGGDANKDEIVASAKGTYAKQPITAEFVGGALLSLRDAQQPYPVDLKLANGPTRASAHGTIADPLHFGGADVTIEIAGPNLALLQPLTGIAFPTTPAHHLTGKLDYSNGVVKFRDFAGRVGSSDLEGNLEVDTKPNTRPVLTADVRSKMVDLKDLGGFIGAEPGDADKGTKRPTPSNGRVLPDQPLSLPKLNAMDVHLKYRAGRIEGSHQPLDNMRADMDIVNGNVTLHPLAFGIGRGQISGNIELAERPPALHAKASIDFQRVDVDKLLSATGVARGAGAINGRAELDGTGRSIAQMLAEGNGELRLYMGTGGNLSALLVDLSGLEFGNALLSALGIPQRTQIQCLVTDFVLQHGEASSRLTMLDTEEARIGLTGGVDLRNEALNLMLRTEAKHFSVGSLPTPIGIKGTMAKPSIQPDLAEAGVRAGAAVGLGVLLTPLAALLPTIELGTGEDNACASLVREVKATPPKAPPSAPAATPARRPVRRRR